MVLTRKLADWLDGVDVSNHQMGDVIDLPPREANVLMAEGWVVRDRRTESVVARTLERRPRANHRPAA